MFRGILFIKHCLGIFSKKNFAKETFFSKKSDFKNAIILLTQFFKKYLFFFNTCPIRIRTARFFFEKKYFLKISEKKNIIMPNKMSLYGKPLVDWLIGK